MYKTTAGNVNYAWERRGCAKCVQKYSMHILALFGAWELNMQNGEVGLTLDEVGGGRKGGSKVQLTYCTQSYQTNRYACLCHCMSIRITAPFLASRTQPLRNWQGRYGLCSTFGCWKKKELRRFVNTIAQFTNARSSHSSFHKWKTRDDKKKLFRIWPLIPKLFQSAFVNSCTMLPKAYLEQCAPYCALGH